MENNILEWGKTKKGEIVKLYILSNGKIKAVVSDFGATLLNLWTKDKDGNCQDVVWGYDTVAEYEENCFFFGGTIGRNANRVANAEINIGDKVYKLDKNDGIHCLHGGFDGYHNRMWEMDSMTDDGGRKSITFLLHSSDMDQGFPGNAEIFVTYSIFEKSLSISYYAKADKKTVFNLTNHSYFNLEGQSSDNVFEHEVFIDADYYTPVNENLIPTGELMPVENTYMDFRKMREIDMEYDHNFCLNDTGKNRKVASMRSKKTGINMNIYTDLDGMQFYTSNMLDSKTGKAGRSYSFNSAVCFETQYFPDACNNDKFKSCVFDADEEYRTTTTYEFFIA